MDPLAVLAYGAEQAPPLIGIAHTWIKMQTHIQTHMTTLVTIFLVYLGLLVYTYHKGLKGTHVFWEQFFSAQMTICMSNLRSKSVEEVWMQILAKKRQHQ